MSLGIFSGWSFGGVAGRFRRAAAVPASSPPRTPLALHGRVRPIRPIDPDSRTISGGKPQQHRPAENSLSDKFGRASKKSKRRRRCDRHTRSAMPKGYFSHRLPRDLKKARLFQVHGRPNDPISEAVATNRNAHRMPTTRHHTAIERSLIVSLFP